MIKILRIEALMLNFYMKILDLNRSLNLSLENQMYIGGIQFCVKLIEKN